MQVEKQMQNEVEVGVGVGVGVEGNALEKSSEQRKGGNGPQAETDTEVEMDDGHDPNDLAKRRILLGGRMLNVKGSNPSAASNSEPKGWMRTLAHAAKDLGLKNPSRRR